MNLEQCIFSYNKWASQEGCVFDIAHNAFAKRVGLIFQLLVSILVRGVKVVWEEAGKTNTQFSFKGITRNS
jgi:hypothetical protein